MVRDDDLPRRVRIGAGEYSSLLQTVGCLKKLVEAVEGVLDLTWQGGPLTELERQRDEAQRVLQHYETVMRKNHRNAQIRVRREIEGRIDEAEREEGI